MLRDRAYAEEIYDGKVEALGPVMGPIFKSPTWKKVYDYLVNVQYNAAICGKANDVSTLIGLC